MQMLKRVNSVRIDQNSQLIRVSGLISERTTTLLSNTSVSHTRSS